MCVRGEGVARGVRGRLCNQQRRTQRLLEHKAAGCDDVGMGSNCWQPAWGFTILPTDVCRVCRCCLLCVRPHMCCVEEAPDSSAQTLRDAYYFLQENGYINFGVVRGEAAATVGRAVEVCVGGWLGGGGVWMS